MLLKCENIIMSKIKLVIGAILVLLVVGLLVSWLSPPSRAGSDDYFVEDIGGDEFLVANFTSCFKLGEQNIPDGCFNASMGTYNYYDAKNISYVDYVGGHDYAIVWKTTPDKYGFDTTDNVNQYISDYSDEMNGVGFIEYSYENNAAYGIIVCKEYKKLSEKKLMYEILGLNKEGFDLVYTQQSPSYSYSAPSSSHYHTVVPDRYTLSRTDPGAYYDHYEYGDNYDIDDYLESEGYD